MSPLMNGMRVPPVEVLPRDISAYRRGTTGIDFVHRFVGPRPGPSVGIAGLTHGNEICGMEAVTWLLDLGLRPRRGTLTLWLGNVAAYEALRADDLAHQTRHRFVDRDMNRVWADDVLHGDRTSQEAARARELLPVVESLDALLDIHSTTFCDIPFLIYPDHPRNRRLAEAPGWPGRHVLMRGGQHSGLTMLERGRFGDATSDALALGVECGTHLSRAACETARQMALGFLDVLDMLPDGFAAQHRVSPTADTPIRRYAIRQVFRPRGDGARFVRGFAPFEEVSAGTPIVVDGDEVFAAPFDRCTILMPSPVATAGRDMVTLAEEVA